MMILMKAIDAKIQCKMPWVPPQQPVYLVMKNSEGEGARTMVSKGLAHVKAKDSYHSAVSKISYVNALQLDGSIVIS